MNPIMQKAMKTNVFMAFDWQGKKASNPRPTVLETAALPAELFPYIIDKAEKWWTVRDSNPGPTGYEPVALPTELTVQIKYCRHDIVTAIPLVGASCRTRTYDPAVNSRMLYLLS